MADYSYGFQKRIPMKYRAMFDDFSDEHGSGDGYWGYLVAGYRCTATGSHIVHEWTMKDFLKSVRNDIEKCDCIDCRMALEENKGVLEQIAEEQNSLTATCKAWSDAIDKHGYVN